MLPGRYLSFIESRKLRSIEDVYVERHHVLPRSFGGTDSEDNIVRLTLREHWIAHYILWMEYKDFKTLSALVRMGKHHPNLCSSKKYERLRIEFYEKMSEIAKGSFWITNGDVDRRCLRSDFPELESRGWKRGRSFGMKKAHDANKGRERSLEERSRMSNRVKNSSWVTDGIHQKLILTSSVEEFLMHNKTWRRGLSETMKNNIGNAGRGRKPSKDAIEKTASKLRGKKRPQQVCDNISRARQDRKSCWISKGSEMKMIHLDELEDALSNGWVRGCKTPEAIERLKKASRSRKFLDSYECFRYS